MKMCKKESKERNKLNEEERDKMIRDSRLKRLRVERATQGNQLKFLRLIWLNRRSLSQPQDNERAERRKRHLRLSLTRRLRSQLKSLRQPRMQTFKCSLQTQSWIALRKIQSANTRRILRALRLLSVILQKLLLKLQVSARMPLPKMSLTSMQVFLILWKRHPLQLLRMARKQFQQLLDLKFKNKNLRRSQLRK